MSLVVAVATFKPVEGVCQHRPAPISLAAFGSPYAELALAEARIARMTLPARPQEEQEKLEQLFWVDGHLNPKLVGQSAAKIAAMAGITVPPQTVVLGVFETRVGQEVPFSHEKLCPILTVYRTRVRQKIPSEQTNGALTRCHQASLSPRKQPGRQLCVCSHAVRRHMLVCCPRFFSRHFGPSCLDLDPDVWTSRRAASCTSTYIALYLD